MITSCAKEGNAYDNESLDLKVENRDNATANFCTPRDIYPVYTQCFEHHRAGSVDLSLGLTLYSTQSLLFQLCPGVSFPVSYDYTTCYQGTLSEIHFIFNLEYNLADIIAVCPALQTEIDYHITMGTLVSFLDVLDFEISRQVEFQEAYDAALAGYIQGKYICEEGKKFYDVKFIENTCYKWVEYVDGPKDRPINAYKKEDCGDPVCCIRIGQYCNEKMYEGEPVLQGSANTTYEKTTGECMYGCEHDCGERKLETI